MEWLHSNSPDKFKGYAKSIINGSTLVIGDKWHRVLAIEVYLHNEAHPDPYVQRDPQQLTVGEWYAQPDGLSITFGAGAYGSMLICALQTPEFQIIEGPQNVVNYILERSGCKSVEELVKYDRHPTMSLGIFCTKAITNMPVKSIDFPVYMSRRSGLDSSLAPEYAGAPYRFSIMPHLLKKDRELILDGLREFHKLSDSEIKKILREE